MRVPEKIDLDSIDYDNVYVEKNSSYITVCGASVSDILDTIGEDTVKEYFGIGE